MSKFAPVVETCPTAWRLGARRLAACSVILALAMSTAGAQGQGIDTFAGTGTAGYSGDGGAATAATLYGPHGIAVGANGDVFVADKVNQVIRKVDFLTGVISTHAGGGTLQLGDGEPAPGGWLDSPYAVAIDAAGNVYFSDTNHDRIRKIRASTGIISTIAGTGDKGYAGEGGQAVNAWIKEPKGVAVDSVGNVIFADTGNHRIRKVDVATGIITTLAGSGTKGWSGGGPATSANLDLPHAVVVDGSDNVYFADTENHCIRKVAASDGTIDVVAGKGNLSGYTGDGGSATNARLDTPRGVWVDSAGNIYIADSGNHRIRKVDVATGNINTIAGTGTRGYSGDGGPATSANLDEPDDVSVNSAGDVFFSDCDNHRIRKIDGSSGDISTYGGTGVSGDSGDGGPATAAMMDNPRGVFVVAASGDLFLTDTDNHVIRKITAATGIITLVVGHIDDTGIGDTGTATDAFLHDIEDLDVDSAGNLYIAATTQDRIRKVDTATGTIDTIMGRGDQTWPTDPTADLLLLAPSGVALDDAGNVYVADTLNHRIVKLTVATMNYTVLVGTGVADYSGDGGSAVFAELDSPGGVAVDTSGNVYIADTENHRVRKIDAATGDISTVAGKGIDGFAGDGGAATAAKVGRPQRVEVDARGDLYIAQASEHVIRKVNMATGNIKTLVGTGVAGSSGDGGAASAAQINTPLGIGFKRTDPSSPLASWAIYVSDSANNKVRVVRMIFSWREVPNRTP